MEDTRGMYLKLLNHFVYLLLNCKVTTRSRSRPGCRKSFYPVSSSVCTLCVCVWVDEEERDLGIRTHTQRERNNKSFARSLSNDDDEKSETTVNNISPSPSSPTLCRRAAKAAQPLISTAVEKKSPRKTEREREKRPKNIPRDK